MEVKQIYTIVNDALAQTTGVEAILTEDLGNLVDAGKQVFDSDNVDNFAHALVDVIGKQIFVNRVYEGRAPKVLMDAWEFGSVLEKVRTEIPTASENESWNLVDGMSYDTQIFYGSKINVKFYNSKTTFEIDKSFSELQLKEAFLSATQMNGFLSMLYTSVSNALTKALDNLIMRTINNMIGETIYADYQGGSLDSKSGARAINLFYLYKQDNPSTTLTATTCLKDADFVRYATYHIWLIMDRIKDLSTLFNIGKTEKFTPKELLHVVLLSDFKRASDVFLQSDTYHKELVDLPQAETVAYLQGTGTDYDFASVSKIDVVTSEGHTVEASGIIGVMFDRDALGVSNLNQRVTTSYNAKAEFFTNYYKFDAGFFNDFNENCVVFLVA